MKISAVLISTAVAAIGSVLPVDVFAYPSTVGFGYQACAACHYNPYGNGPLTDYGRALSASLVAARPFWISDSVSDDDLSEKSGIFGDPEVLPEWVRLSGDLRGLYLSKNLGSEQSQSRFIPMQAEGSVIIQPAPGRLFGVLTLGYAPPPSSLPASEKRLKPVLISREHYLGWRLSRAVGLYVGMMDPVFGIRVPDHDAFSRKETGLNHNDQSHALLANLGFGKWEVGAQVLAGNLFQNPSLRQRGASLSVEHSLSKKASIGVSALFTFNEYRQRRLAAVFSRLGFGSGSSLLAESGLIERRPKKVASSLGQYVFLQGTGQLARGLNFLTTLEYYSERAFEDARRQFRIAPGLQYFPMQRLELRTELRASRSIGQAVVAEDILSLLTQVHLWF